MSEMHQRGEREVRRGERQGVPRCAALVPDTKRPRRPTPPTPPRTHRGREPQSNRARSSNDGELGLARRGDLPPHQPWVSTYLPPDEAAPIQEHVATLESN